MQTFASGCQLLLGMKKFISKATLQDIARELSITPSTVSRALHDHEAISEAMKKAVRKTARRLHYRPNKIASSLRLGRSHIIGVIIPSAEINFFGSVVHGIEKVATEKGYNVLLYQSNERTDVEKNGVETFLRSRVDAVLASISKETKGMHHYLEIKRRGIPLVLFDRVNEGLGVPSVVVDDYQGAFEATQHLVSQGCTRIAHIAGHQHLSIFKKRLNGYIDALIANNLPVNEAIIIQGEVTIESGYTCMHHLLSMDQEPDGVFAVEDFTALGAVKALKEKGKKVPDEVAVIGFANEAFGEYITPSLSTVNQQTVKMGEEAANLFFDLSSKDHFYTHSYKQVVLKPELIFRESSVKKRT